MGRYYKIVVGPEVAVPTGGTVPSGNSGGTWTNRVNGRADLGAQTVELDIHAYSFDAPISQAFVRIWGPSRQQISQASDFNGAPISVWVGMQNGLPLASADVSAGQQGLVLSGQVFQAFGNYQGINQSLDFVVTTDGGATQSSPAALSFTWKKGQQLSSVIQSTLAAAYPALNAPVVNISPNLVLNNDEAGVYQTLQQFASYLNGVSQDIVGGTYSGVKITLVNGTIQVFDGTVPLGQTTSILAQDLVGPPTWLSVATVQLTTVMRADLQVGSQITLPQLAGLQAVTTPQSQSNARSQGTFSGTWTVIYLRHVGNSRDPNAQSWVTTIQAISNAASPAALSVANSSS